MMNKVKTLLKGVKTKKAVVDLVNNLHPQDLTTEGKAIVSYLNNLFEADMKDMKLSEMKEEVLTLLQEKSFRNMENAPVIFENAIKPKKVTVKKSTAKVEEPKENEATEEVATDEEADKLLNSLEKKSDKDKKTKDKKVEKKKELSSDRIFELVGYRYVYPKFPETFTSPILPDKTFHIVEEDDPKEIQKLYDAMLEGTGDNLVVAMYFPEYERDYDVDPHGIVSYDTPLKQVLKKYGGKFPNNLDVQSIVHFDANAKALVSVSAFTGIPYAISCRQNLFITNNDLRCRVSQNGLDYQIYRVK